MGMRVRFDRIVFGGQTERIEAHREQHVIALHTALARNDLKARIRLDMPDVHARAGRIRELDKSVEFLVGPFLRLEAFLLRPLFLPLFFDRGKIISFRHRMNPFRLSILDFHVNLL